MSAYSFEAAAKYYIQRAWVHFRAARRLQGGSERTEPLVVLGHHAMMDAARALLFALEAPVDGCEKVLLAFAALVAEGKATEEMHSMLHESASLFFKIHRRSMIPADPRETESLLNNVRTILREVRDRIEQRYGLIEGL